MNFKRSIRSAMATAMVLGAVGLFSGTASAATSGNGYCESGDSCFYYLKSQSSYIFDPETNIPNFSPMDYARQTSISPNDNTMSYWNRSSRTWHVYTNSFRGGVHGWVPAGHKGDTSSNFTNSISSAYNFA
ncbi:hypothetical protein L1I79_33315 [Strepomyces sp. STD 3.1]|uniref:hypothetical protein n=1 Tax=Streptomyces sp. NPDC058985 TaxID=3346684 RepID=UPI001F385F03|nr:hypothetical protein [Streptomyces sp. STD 3.1]